MIILALTKKLRLNLCLFVTTLMLFLAPSWADEERLSVNNFNISKPCMEWVGPAGLTSFELKGDFHLPDVVVRSPASEVKMTSIWFGEFSWGLLLEKDGQRIIHCNEPMTTLEFALVEQAERVAIFDLIKTTEVHFHSSVNCGSPCRYAQIDTVVFSDTTGPYGFTEMKSSAYPSKWFRAYLTENEKREFDREIGGG